MKLYSNTQLLATPNNDNDIVNKKYVDKRVPDEVLYSEEITPIDKLVISGTEAETLHGLTWDKFALANHTHDSSAFGLDNVTNNKQIKAPLDSTVYKNHVPVFLIDGDGSSVKDSGFTINKSVPEDALFTDTTYENATIETSGLMSNTDKEKLNNIDLEDKIYYFSSVEDMKNYDIASFSKSYAYGIVGEEQYRYKASNSVDSTYGKWRKTNEIFGDIINIKDFTLDDNGVLSASVQYKDSSGLVIEETTEEIGKIALNPRKNWLASETYNKLDMVYYDDELYICLKNAVTVNPDNTDSWLKCSQKPLNNYELYVMNTSDPEPMTYEEWADSLKGESGNSITDIEIDDNKHLIIDVESDTPNPETGEYTVEYDLGRVVGKSAYEVAVDNGFEGSEEEWLDSLGGTTAKLKNKHTISGIEFDGSQDVQNLAICSSPTSSVEKEISISGWTKSFGAELFIEFINGNTAENITLKVNELAALPILYNNDSIPSDIIKEHSIIHICVTSFGYEVVGFVSNGDVKIDIDDELSKTSENPVQNKVITNKIETLEKSIPIIASGATAGQFAVSDGSGGIAWVTIKDASEEEY